MPAMSARRNGNRARCQHEGCEKFAQTRGLCKAHGGGSRCRDPSCNKLAQSRGLCIAHGGGRRCQHDGCSKLAQSKGFCISHGGGRRCTVPNCEKFSQVKGRCKSHSKLADHSDLEGDDGEETETEQMSDRTMASPPQYQTHPAHPLRTHSPPSPMHAESTSKFRFDYITNPAAALHAQRSQDALPLPPPRSFGLTAGMPPRQPLLPPRPVHLTVGNRENIYHQSAFERKQDDDFARRGAFHASEETLKRVPSFNSRMQPDEELPPLPYTYQLPSSRPMFGALETKQESDEPHHGYALLPSRFLQSRPPSAVTTGAMTMAHGIMMSSAPHAASTHDHFVSHKHAEQAVEPTSIPLLSFLDRSKDTASSPSMRHPSWVSSSTSAMASSNTTTAPFGTSTTTSSGGSPPLPSIVLPPLNRNNQNSR